jgi:hypothetical protein
MASVVGQFVARYRRDRVSVEFAVASPEKLWNEPPNAASTNSAGSATTRQTPFPTLPSRFANLMRADPRAPTSTAVRPQYQTASPANAHPRPVPIPELKS